MPYVKKLDRLIQKLNEMKNSFVSINENKPQKKNVHIITGQKILRKQLMKKQPNNIKSRIKNKKTLETDIGFLMKRMNKTKNLN